MSHERSLAHVFALLVGVVYLAIGILGFLVTGFDNFISDGNAKFAGFFDLNGFHNVVHIAVGAYLLLVTKFDAVVAEGALIGGGIVYLVAAFLGFTNNAQILSINSSGSVDNYFHLASGAAVLIVGLASAARTSAARKTSY